MLQASAIAFALTFGGSFLIDAAFKASIQMANLDVRRFEDALEAWPLMLARSVAGGCLAVVASAMLFTLAFAEARGEDLRLDMAFAPLMRPFPLLWAGAFGAALSFVTTLGIWYFTDDWVYFILTDVLLILTGPFYMFVLPRVLDRGVSVGEAARENIVLGLTHYPSLLGVVLRAVVMSMWGMLLLVVGYIWTQPNYQRIIVEEYRKRFAPPESPL